MTSPTGPRAGRIRQVGMWGIFGLARLWLATLRPRWQGDENEIEATLDGPCIYAFFHRALPGVLRPYAASGCVPLISLSRDGDWLTAFVQTLGYRGIRGSSSRGGAQALGALLQVLEEGRSVAIAVDGPRGPAGHAHSGALRLAALSGRPILPVATATRGFQLGTWDRMRIPIPGSRVVIARGCPITLGPNALADQSLPRHKKRLEDALETLEDRCGRGPARSGRLITGPASLLGGSSPTPPVWDRFYRITAHLLWTALRVAHPILTRLPIRALDFLDERLGVHPIDSRDRDAHARAPGIWFHAASLGESALACRVALCLRDLGYDDPLHLTVMTRAARRMPAPAFASRSVAPLDAPKAITQWLDRMRPKVLVLVESELWPTMIGESSKRGIPIIVVNAKISDRSFNRYMKYRKAVAPLFHALHVLARDETQARRYRALGVPPSRIRVGGNLKRIPAPPPLAAVPKVLVDWMDRRPTLLAASTHAPEEECLLRVVDVLRRRFPVNLLLAPRHIHRPDLKRGRLKFIPRRSLLRDDRDVPETVDVMLLDSHGELRALYPHACCVFAGGTIARVGGHNILEAVRAGRTVICGPRRDAIGDDIALLEDTGAIHLVRTHEEIATVVEALVRDPGECRRRGRAGRDRLLAADPSHALGEALRQWLP